MKTLYIDCPTGISGDMFLAALIDMGVDHRLILSEVEKLAELRSEMDVAVGHAMRHSIKGTTFRVRHTEAPGHRTFRDIKRLIKESALAPEVKKLSTEIFKRIAVAEGRVHGISPDRVHFHEVGAIDSIIDIVGAAAAVRSLGVDSIRCSPIPLGSGWADTMHGRIPIPAPATVEILKGIPTAESDIPMELTTPTGAAIAATIADGFGPMPAMTIERVGYGAGKKDIKSAANLLRAIIGERGERAGGAGGGGGAEEGGGGGGAEGRTLVMLETNIDDMSPQVAGYLAERLLDTGALDAFYTPVVMKKSRPGVLLSVLSRQEHADMLLDVIFTESTTIGVRRYPVDRRCLERAMEKVRTRYGTIRVKVSSLAGRIVNLQPEYEDCRAAAIKKKVPIKDVMDAARGAMEKAGGGGGGRGGGG